MTLDSEEPHPEDEGDQNGEARGDEGARADVEVDPAAEEDGLGWGEWGGGGAGGGATGSGRRGRWPSVWACKTWLTAGSRAAAPSCSAARRSASASSTRRRVAPPSKMFHSRAIPMP